MAARHVITGLFRQGGGQLNPEAQPTYRTGIGFVDRTIGRFADALAGQVEISGLEGRQYRLVQGASETGIIDTRSLADKERMVIDVPPQIGAITQTTPGVRYEFKRSVSPKIDELRQKNGGRITFINPGDGNGKPVVHSEVYDLTVTAYASKPNGEPIENRIIDGEQVILSSVHPKSGVAIGDTVARNLTPEFTGIQINEFGHVILGARRVVRDFAGNPTTFAQDGSTIHLVNKSLIAGRSDVVREIPLGLRVVEPVGTVNLLQPHTMIGDPTQSWLYEAAQNNAANGQPRGIQIIDPTIPM